MRGRLRNGLFPSLFLLECRNLSEEDVFRLRNTKELSVMREDSCLAFGRVSDLFCRTVPEGTVTAMTTLPLEAKEILPVPMGVRTVSG